MKTSTHLFCLYQLILVCILLSTNYKQISSSKIRPPTSSSSTFITKSCHTTLYPHLCNATLAKYATTVKKSPKRLAITALLVTLKTTKMTSVIVRNMTRINRGALKRGEKAALIECVEEVGDAVYEIQKALKEFNHTRKGRPNFELQINDVQTWVSAALTDDDTCMDDFTTRGKVKVFVRRMILTVAHLTSIALTFINNYAALV